MGRKGRAEEREGEITHTWVDRCVGWKERERERETSFLTKAASVPYPGCRNIPVRVKTQDATGRGCASPPVSFRDNSRDTIIRMKIERANNTLRQAESYN